MPVRASFPWIMLHGKPWKVYPSGQVKLESKSGWSMTYNLYAGETQAAFQTRIEKSIEEDEVPDKWVAKHAEYLAEHGAEQTERAEQAERGAGQTEHGTAADAEVVDLLTLGTAGNATPTTMCRRPSRASSSSGKRLAMSGEMPPPEAKRPASRAGSAASETSCMSSGLAKRKASSTLSPMRPTPRKARSEPTPLLTGLRPSQFCRWCLSIVCTLDTKCEARGMPCEADWRAFAASKPELAELLALRQRPAASSTTRGAQMQSQRSCCASSAFSGWFYCEREDNVANIKRALDHIRRQPQPYS